MNAQLTYLNPGAARYTGLAQRYIDFTMSHQLMNAETWRSFVRVFRDDSDDADRGWRCEYWGKMMRGACLTYLYNGDDALYAVLEETVRDLLTAQRPDGRFSTYSASAQLNGWDVWGRKYVLTASLHFYRICKDEALKKQLLNAMCRHADALIDMVGEGKISIVHTSNFWGGVNSASILDAMVDLYNVTGKQAYLDFASHIISTGGCQDGNLIELAYENKVMPYEYPEIKAYETISFFEGVLSYYQVTKDEKLLTAVLNFVESVYATDITVIGCSGCTHELFDHSAVKQVLYSEGIMQETCVTVTWMRMMAKLLLLTGEEKYFARMEISAYNALYGSTNDHGLKQVDLERNEIMEPLPFDSYSPLYNNPRGRGIGGLKRFTFGGYYGCCACIAAAGIAIFPLCALLKQADGFVFNGYLPGVIQEITPGSQKICLTLSGSYPVAPVWKLQLQMEKAEEMTLKFRLPNYMVGQTLTLNGQTLDLPADGGYLTVTRTWNPGDTLTCSGSFRLEALKIDGRTAFIYGPLVLARDSNKEGRCVDLEETVRPVLDSFRMETPDERYGEVLRLVIPQRMGEPLLLTDYASCGKHWEQKNNRMTVWMNVE